MRKPLSLYHPWLYWLRVWQRRLWRHCRWRLGGRRYVRLPSVDERLPYRYIKHTSKLIRRLGDSDLALQRNKVVNLRLAVDCMNGVSIGPGEYFSFCRLVGRPSARRGFVEGMELSFGEARSGIGGGICQLSNLIHWMALHSPLRVVERANHSFDPFPDEGRILPFGSGAAIFYNFIDLVLHNPTADTFQLRFHIARSTSTFQGLPPESIERRKSLSGLMIFTQPRSTDIQRNPLPAASKRYVEWYIGNAEVPKTVLLLEEQTFRREHGIQLASQELGSCFQTSRFDRPR
ncbi:TPA: VanW family protein [Pseudomonas aeruginosa]